MKEALLLILNLFVVVRDAAGEAQDALVDVL
jgi:hypothetical protein